MEEFNTLEQVKELFNKVDCIGNENCYFIAFKDLQRNSGMVNGMEYPYNALLINQTENGLGIFYIKPEKFSLKLDITKMKVVTDSYFFVKNDEIKNITVKNFAIFNSKTKRISIKLNNGKHHQLYAKTTDNMVPYQIENLSKFIEKYSK